MEIVRIVVCTIRVVKIKEQLPFCRDSFYFVLTTKFLLTSF